MCTRRRFRSKSVLQAPTWRTLEELTTDATGDEVVVTRSLLGKGRVGKRKGGGWMLINVGKVFEEEEVEAGLRLSGESFEDLQRKQQGNYNQENVFDCLSNKNWKLFTFVDSNPRPARLLRPS